MKPICKIRYDFLIAGIVFILASSCNFIEKPKSTEPPDQPANQVVCSKGLAYSECPNPQAMHGQVMVHNMTERTFDVKLDHHDSASETKQIAPGDGWTFTGVLQGKRLITAKPSTGGYVYESSCTVIGNTQHMMNILHDGLFVVNPSKRTVREKEDTTVLIKLPERKSMDE